MFDEQLQTLRILIAWIAHVRTTLIVDNTLDRIVQNGVKRTIAPHQPTKVVILLLEVDDTRRVRRFLGVFLQVLLRQPAFYSRAALVGLDESNGDVECLVHHLRKEIARCRELADRLWRTLAPLGVSILLRRHSHDAGNLRRAHLTLASTPQYLLIVVQHRTVAKALDRHLHIRLASAHPNLTSEDVLDGHCTLSVVKGDVQRLVTGLG